MNDKQKLKKNRKTMLSQREIINLLKEVECLEDRGLYYKGYCNALRVVLKYKSKDLKP